MGLNMKHWHSTTLRMITDHCPQALRWYVDGKPYSRDVFGTGLAAHAVLQAFHDQRPADEESAAALSRKVAESLMAEGYTFRDQQQPPIKPDDAIAGANLAMQYLIERDIPQGEAERDFKSGRLGAIVDLVYPDTVGGEDWAVDVVAIRDYKTAWNTNSAELDTLQRKIQALCVIDNYPGAQAVRLEVVNVRTRWTYDTLLVLDEDGQAKVNQWRAEIDALCDAAEKALSEPIARPGAGCIDCPYTIECEACSIAAAHIDELPIAIATCHAILKEATKLGKSAFKESPVEIPGGAVGYFETTRRTVSPDRIFELYCQFTGLDAGDVGPLTRGFLAAAKLGTTQADNLLKVIYPQREEREAAAPDVFETKTGQTFKVVKG